MPAQPEKLRILLVDDHDVVRVGLRTLLESQPGLAVVGEAGSAGEAIAEAARCEPDVVVMDIRLPDGSGVEACREIRARQPNVQVLMLTSYADDEAVFASILAGAAGYVLKQIRGKALVEAIATVGAGGSLLDPTVTQKVLQRLRSEDSREKGGVAGLSEQEQRILTLVAEGRTNREIAETLCLSEGTVKNYVSSILGKLNLSRRAQLVAYVARSRRPPA
jgi:DNA-binding NarL/FixJ family response regulator